MSGDTFDLESLRLSQNFAATLGVKKALTTVPVRRPDRQWFLRTHPDPDFRIETAVLELKEESETYLVAPNMRNELAGEVVAKVLITAVTRQRNVFLWPIRMPDEFGKLDEWNRSAFEAAKVAGFGVERKGGHADSSGAVAGGTCDLAARCRKTQFQP